MSLQYKAYLYEGRPCRSKEIRRFTVDHDVSSSYEYLRRKIASVFPNLGNNNFSLQWKDQEGDLIWFNSDEELVQALSQNTGDVFKIYIKEHTSNSQQKEGGPRCGFGQDFSRWQQPFMAFNPECHGNFPFFATNSSDCKAGPEKRDQGDAKPTASAEENQQSQSSFSGKEYLQTMGNAVADFLQPFGIDVDINVEHKGETAKCPGTKHPDPSAPSKEADAETSGANPSPENPDKESSSDSSDREWTFVKKEKATPSSTSADDTMETDEDSKLRDSLNQLLAMGFNDQGGWLTNLLKASNGDISRALDAMQPAKSSKQ